MGVGITLIVTVAVTGLKSVVSVGVKVTESVWLLPSAQDGAQSRGIGEGTRHAPQDASNRPRRCRIKLQASRAGYRR